MARKPKEDALRGLGRRTDHVPVILQQQDYECWLSRDGI